jgi:putative OPT family oligopeptide transporter
MRLTLYRPLGIGMLVGAAVGGILAAFPLIVSAMKSMHAAREQQDSGVDGHQDEMSIRTLYGAIAIGALVMIWIAFQSVESMTLGRAAAMALLGTLWVWVAGVVVAECIGRTNWSPLSGMTLIAVTILIVIAKSGLNAAETITSSMLVGAAICLAISQASDMMLDLKSGYLVGAIPRRQQLAQFVGAWLGPIIVIGLMILLNDRYGIGSDRLPAPQAQALASVTEGILNDNVPTYRYTAGAGLGLLLALSGLGGIGVLIALGFYMPFQIALTYTLGNIARVVADRQLGHKWSHDYGIPLAAGLIVGEALVGVGYALYKVVFSGSESTDTAWRLGTDGLEQLAIFI